MAQVQVPAILDAINATTAPFTTNSPVTPTPAPTSLIGSPAVTLYNIVVDLTNSSVQFSYFISQSYNAAGGVVGFAYATGSGIVSITGVAQASPGIAVTATPASTSTLSGGVITFTVNATVAYNQISPAIYKVYTEQP